MNKLKTHRYRILSTQVSLVFFSVSIFLLSFSITVHSQEATIASEHMNASEYYDYAVSIENDIAARHEKNMETYMSIMDDKIIEENARAKLDEISADYVSMINAIWDSCIIAETVPANNEEDSVNMSRALKLLTRLNTRITYDYIVYMKPGIIGKLASGGIMVNAAPAPIATGTIIIDESENVDIPEPAPKPDPCVIAEKLYDDARENENNVCADIVQVVKDSPCHTAMKATTDARNEMKATCGLGGTNQ